MAGDRSLASRTRVARARGRYGREGRGGGGGGGAAAGGGAAGAAAGGGADNDSVVTASTTRSRARRTLPNRSQLLQDLADLNLEVCVRV